MRFSLFATLPLAAFALAQPQLQSRAPSAAQLEDRTFGLCQRFETRHPLLCTCLPGFVPPAGSLFKREFDPRDIEEKRTLVTKECVCGDAPNSKFVAKTNKEDAKCVCVGENQQYNKKLDRCECTVGCFEIRNRKTNELICKPEGGQPSPKVTKPRRELEYAARKRAADSTSRAIESVIDCEDNERACKAGGKWSCVDVMSTLATCGGCPGEDAVDCGAIDGVNEVQCKAGKCQIDSCQRGFKLSTSAEEQTCTPLRRGSLFGVQH